nr:MAG TPA: hypothetical protein [Caudoviricetes sp.]
MSISNYKNLYEAKITVQINAEQLYKQTNKPGRLT